MEKFEGARGEQFVANNDTTEVKDNHTEQNKQNVTAMSKVQCGIFNLRS